MNVYDDDVCMYVAALLKRRNRSHNLLRIFKKDGLITEILSGTKIYIRY